ncbi:extracellular solute-binding protein [Agathobaculum sp.]|uniref:extracellular solute-binding protein n=1 Tax=Agathobaculum sp. TaxID=2048138 RepID=UPI002A821AA3|nr:extracellular solute-binding protein [Agathobaculum sp.]MDY3618375.1 extracellular solute-binding protein [Agathobaculum sp.]
MANYFLIGAKQFGVEIFSQKDGKTVLNFDREIMKKIWDNYYVPYVNGWFEASGRFRSDDVKMGGVISFVGSSSGATFFPDAVIVDDEHSYPIEMQVLPAPKFEGGEDVAVQQGAGMVVTEGDEKEVYASVLFLKWFTDASRNSAFSIESGYMPVQKAANDIDFIRENTQADKEEIEQIVSVAIDTVNNNQLYTTKAFANGTEARNVLEYAMFDLAKADRAQVLAEIAKGVSPEEAAAPYLTDEYFDAWYQATKAKLELLAA